MYQIDFSTPVHVYFIGIGGISMSGLAEILLEKHFKVSGSDARQSALTDMLKNRGAHIFIGQKKENITGDIDVVVYTSAIHPDNPEFIAMQELSIPALTRAELLGEIMRNYELPVAISGTHGKNHNNLHGFRNPAAGRYRSHPFHWRDFKEHRRQHPCWPFSLFL